MPELVVLLGELGARKILVVLRRVNLHLKRRSETVQIPTRAHGVASRELSDRKNPRPSRAKTIRAKRSQLPQPLPWARVSRGAPANFFQ